MECQCSGPVISATAAVASRAKGRARLGLEEQVAGAPAQISPRVKELVARHWLEARYAHSHRKVAWVTSGAPVELLKALDFCVIYPENHAAICGTARVAVELATEAENAGYSRDICSYARTDFGTMLSGKTPVGKLPRPDLLVACTNICQTVLFWYRVLARHYGAPLILIDTPFVYYAQASEHAIEFVQRQLEQAVPTMEQVAGRPLDERRLKEVGRLSRMASQLWMEVMERNRHRPAAISAFRPVHTNGAHCRMRGDAVTVDLYAPCSKRWTRALRVEWAL